MSDFLEGVIALLELETRRLLSAILVTAMLAAWIAAKAPFWIRLWLVGHKDPIRASFRTDAKGSEWLLLAFGRGIALWFGYLAYVVR